MYLKLHACDFKICLLERIEWNEKVITLHDHVWLNIDIKLQNKKCHYFFMN